MKTCRFPLLVLVFFFILLTSCQPSQPAAAPTQENTPVSTVTPTPLPIPTNTPEPTPTIEPSPTPMTYPEGLDQIYSNPSVLYKDVFNFKIEGREPAGWFNTEGNLVLREAKEGNFRIVPKIDSGGGGFYFGNEVINPGEGVFFTFQYSGTENVFTWGFDNLNGQGELNQYKTEGYFSFAMQMYDTYPNGHVIEGLDLKDDDFQGDLILQENTWYNITMAIDLDKNCFIKIWEPDSPEKSLVYNHNWPEAANEYYFVSWIGTDRVLRMDDFTIFTFDQLIQ